MPMEEKKPASSSDLPPRRTKPAIRSVKPPLHSIRFTNFIYALAALAIFFLAYYAYRIVQWKTEVGGWWDMALGRRPPQMSYQTSTPQADSGERDLESRISDLADMLGIKPTDLASAISDVVKEHIPPKTFSSLSSSASAAAAEKTAVQALFGVNGQETGSGTAAKAVVDALENVIGFDEPIELD